MIDPATPAASIRIEPWGPGDHPLLELLVGDPRMMEHLGGPESPGKIAERQARYQRRDPGEQMFKIVLADERPVGWVGYWQRDWHGRAVYEIGWAILRADQGRGIATRATAQAIAAVRAGARLENLHAFPGVANPASNAICHKLGFILVGPVDLDYPPGATMRCNDWHLPLRPDPGAP